MKAAVFSVFAGALLASAVSIAASGKLPPTNDGSGREQCAYYDAGKTEEHGPHRSLGECQAAHNNSCQMMCFVYEYSCKVEGVTREIIRLPDGRTEQRERVHTYTGTDRDRFRAEDQARWSCERDFPRNDSCRIQRCDENASRTH